MTVTIDKFGRILIPKPLRDRLGLDPGTPLHLAVRDAGPDGPAAIELRPEQEAGALVQVGPLLVHQGRPPRSGLDVAELLRSQREARAQRQSGLEGDP